MSDPSDEREQHIMEQVFLMRAHIKRYAAMQPCFLSRLGGEVTLTYEEIEFNNKTYEVIEDAQTNSDTLIQIHLKLKLR